MRILLIDPPFYRFMGYYNRYFPLGLAMIAGALRKKGHEVEIYDADANVNPNKMDFSRLEDSYIGYLNRVKDNNDEIWIELKQKLKEFKPDVIGVGVWTTYAASAFKIAEICKSTLNGVPVIFGGPHITIKYDETLKICKNADFLIRGEGENTIVELISLLSEKKSDELESIKGLSFRKDRDIVHNQNRPFIEDLDNLPLPARELLVNKGSYDSEDMGLIMTGRGCPYLCAYCATAIWGRKVRNRSLEHIFKEVEIVKSSYHTVQFTFKDDSFTVNKNRVTEFCNELIKRKLNIKWDCNTRVDLVDKALLCLMKKAGCIGVKVGIETGSERVLSYIEKGTTLDKARKAAKIFKETGMFWTAYLMMGVPSETKEEVLQSINFMKELKPDYISFSVYEPFPGTKLFDIGVEKGLVCKERNYEDYFNINPKYYYVKDIERKSDAMNIGEMAELEELIKNEIHIYNKSFGRLYKRAISKSMVYFKDPKVFVRDIKKFLAWL